MGAKFKFIPNSHFSYFSIGNILSNIYSKQFQFGFIEFFLLLSFLFIFKFKKIRWLLIGIIFFQTILVFRFAFYKKELPFTKKDLEQIQKNKKEINLEITKQIRKGYYVSKLKIENYETSIILKSYSIDLKEYNYFCASDQIQFLNEKKEISEGEESFVISFKKECKKTKLNSEREKFKFKIISILEENNFSGDVLDVSLGLLLGNSNYLDKDLKEKIREGGLLHLFAASGLHIGILVGFVYSICKKIFFFNYYTEKIFPIFVGLIYLVFLNFPVSLKRAFLFLFISFISSIYFRKIKPIDLIFSSIFFILMLNPNAIFHIGFLLSYSAVFGILILKEFLDETYFLGYKNFFTENFTISLSAMIGTYLVLVYYFHSFSFGSLGINFLLVPYASFVLPCLYLSFFIELIHSAFPIFLFKKYLWILSHFLIEKLIEFSIYLSENFSYYLELENTESFVYTNFFVFVLFIFFFYFLRKIELKSFQISRNLFVVFCSFFSLGFFLIWTYFQFEQKSNEESKKVFANFDFYLIKEENKVYLGGTCKYSEYKIKKSFKYQFCKNATEIYFETDTCENLAEICKSKSKPKANLIQITKKFPKKFKEYYFFQTAKDSLTELSNETKIGKGKIILFFPYKSKDKIKDWEENKNLLGIGENWKFITFDEL